MAVTACGGSAIAFAAAMRGTGEQAVNPRPVLQPRARVVCAGRRVGSLSHSGSCSSASGARGIACTAAAAENVGVVGNLACWAAVAAAAAATGTISARRRSWCRMHRRAGHFGDRSAKRCVQCSRTGLQALAEPVAEVETQSQSRQPMDLQTTDRGSSRIGVVLLNMGTPVSTDVEDVRAYLAKFLTDERVIEIDDSRDRQAVIERLLKSAPAKSAESYKKIWDPERGSPLLYHTEDLVASLRAQLGSEYEVCIGFQYSEPSVETALLHLMSLSINNIVLVPMYPHFAQATGAAFLANTCKVAAKVDCKAYLQVVRPFYKNPGYIDAAHRIIAGYVGPNGRDVDHIVFSFHGIPEAQCTRTDETGEVCMKVPDCCSRRGAANRNCYRAQCVETAELLARKLGLPEDHWSAAFQSRASVRGSIRWTTPFTDELLADLARRGKTRVAVCAPSYTADCIETLGELGNDGREIFRAAGGDELVVIPCINSSEVWAQNLAQMIRDMPRTVEEAVQRAGGASDYWAM